MRPRRLSRRRVPCVNAVRWGLRSRRSRPVKSSSSVARAGIGSVSSSPSSVYVPDPVLRSRALTHETLRRQLQDMMQLERHLGVGRRHGEPLRAVVGRRRAHAGHPESRRETRAVAVAG